MNKHINIIKNKVSIKSLAVRMGTLLLIPLSACQPINDRSSVDDNTQDNDPAQTNLTSKDQNSIQNKSSGQADNSERSDDTTLPTQTASIIQFPQYLDGMPALLHPITPIITVDEEGILSSVKSRGGDYESKPIFEETTAFDYRTYSSNIVFENLLTGSIQKLLVNDDFIIRQIFLPFTTQPLPLNQTNAKVDTNDATSAAENLQDNDNDKIKDKDSASTNDSTLYGYAIYHISETPYKKDEKGKNIMRQQMLYMSDTMGKSLMKLHPANEFVKDSKWMPEVRRYYFMTQSDSDGNGLIDDKDQTHNYQIDFKADKPVVRKYEF